MRIYYQFKAQKIHIILNRKKNGAASEEIIWPFFKELNTEFQCDPFKSSFGYKVYQTGLKAEPQTDIPVSHTLSQQPQS